MFGRSKGIRVEVFGKTDLGRTRDHNEDRFLVADLSRKAASLLLHVAQRGGRFARLGIDEMAPVVCRGVLLDVPAVHGSDVLPAAYPINADDLQAAADRGVELRCGDAALIRTGWARHFGNATAYLGHESGVPGPTEQAARWLVERGVRVTGADTIAYEHIPAGAGHSLLPVHRLLLVEHGIHIVEVMNLEQIAAAGVCEFLFILAPLKIVGATGSPVRPLAVVTP